MFKQSLISLPEVRSEDTVSGRFYVTPSGNRYPSVTTFLSRFSDSSWLDEWIERVGEEQASRVSTQAKNRGTAVHAILEKIVVNDPQYARGQMPNNLIMAESIADDLREHLSEVYGVELGLWSDVLGLGGRADLFGKYDGVNSIIDFKTSKFIKKEDEVESYFLQCTIYSLMVEELTGVHVPQIVVLIGTDFEEKPVKFVKRRKQYFPKLLDMMKRFTLEEK